MKLEIERLIAQYPELNYEDGYLYATPDDEGYLHDKGVPLDGKHLISEYFEGNEICINPEEPDPTKEEYAPASGKANIDYWHNGDFNKALRSIF